MNNLAKYLKIYLSTSDKYLLQKNVFKKTEEAFQNGITAFQYRSKNIKRIKNYILAKKFQKLCKKYNIFFVINDNFKLATKLKSDGLHIGFNDIKKINIKKLREKFKGIIGASVSSFDEYLNLKKFNFDYYGVGSIFNTITKNDAKHINLRDIKKIKAQTEKTIIGIGGINQNNVSKIQSLVEGICIISFVYESKNIKKDLEKLIKILSNS